MSSSILVTSMISSFGCLDLEEIEFTIFQLKKIQIPTPLEILILWSCPMASVGHHGPTMDLGMDLPWVWS